jgi:type IV secretory pathway VirB6-like protein
MVFCIRTLICFLLISILSSCTETCIDPDDFGFETVAVPAKYKKEDISGSKLSQIVPWIDTKLYANGQPISVFVRNWKYIKNSSYSNLNNYSECSAWSPWYGENSETKGSLLSKTTYRLPECKFEDNKMCQSYEGIYAKIKNAPCLLKKGIGLYGLLSDESPNRTNLTKENPNGMSFHIGQCSLNNCSYQNKTYEIKSISKDGVMENVGGIIYDPRTQAEDSDDYQGEEQLNSNSAPTHKLITNKHKIYLKILDTHYEDNSGQYIAVFKSGFADYKTNFFDSVSRDIKKMIFGEKNPDGSENLGIVGFIYTKTIANSSFRFFVKFVMIVYVIIYGAMISIGAARLNQFEILSRLSKLILISMLISDPGINFFSKYLLSFFWDGAYFFKDLALGRGSESYDNGDILNTVFSVQVLTKLAAIVLSNILGIVYALVFFIAMIYFCYVIFQTYVRFVTATIVLGLIIALSPVYFSFMLLGVTKKFFDIWMRQAFYYTILPLFLFIGIGITSKIIKEQIYVGLGFPVCRVSIFSFPDFSSIFSPKNEQYSGDTSIISWVVPKIAEKHIKIVKNADGENIIKDSNIPFIPVPYTTKTKPNSSEPYAPYELIEQRYPDLPYLSITDPEHVKKIISFTNGNLTDFAGLAVICICIYLLTLYNSESETIARAIGNVDLNSVSIGSMSKVTSGAMSHTFDKYISKAAAKLTFTSGFRTGIKDALYVAKKAKKKYLTEEGLTKLFKKSWNKGIDKLDHKIFKDNENVIRKEIKNKDWKPSDKEMKQIAEYDIKVKRTDDKGNKIESSIELNQINFKAQEVYEKKIEEILNKAGKIDISYKKVNQMTDDIVINEEQKKRALVKYFANRSPSELKKFLIENKYGIKDSSVKTPDWIKNEIDATFDTRNKQREIKVNKIFTELKLNSDLYDRKELGDILQSKKPRTKEQMELLKLAVSDSDYKIIQEDNNLLNSGKKGSDKIKNVSIKMQGDLSSDEFKEYLQKYKEYNQGKYNEASKGGVDPKNKALEKELSDLKRKIDSTDIYSYDKDRLKEFLHEQKTGKTKDEINKIIDANFDYKDNTKDILNKYNLDEKTLKDISYDQEKLSEYVKNNLENKIAEDLKNDKKSPYNDLINANQEKERIASEKQEFEPRASAAKEKLNELKGKKAELLKNKSDQGSVSKAEEKIDEEIKDANNKVKMMEQEIKRIEENARNTDKALAKIQKNVDDYKIKARKEFNDSISDYMLNKDSLDSIYYQKQDLDSFKEQYLALKTEGLIKG